MKRDSKGRFAKRKGKENVLIPMLVGVGLFALYISLGINQHVEPTPVVYASEFEFEPNVILIGTKVNWTPERIEEEIRKVFWEEPDTAVAIAKCRAVNYAPNSPPVGAELIQQSRRPRLAT